jgi:thiosulfate/3-mercaptopyruvate sulfurtransferase
VPWAKAVDPETHTCKSAAELRKLYEQDNALKKHQETIAYCRIGERSSHTWFALKYLLGHDKVRNYDGSWTEWGNAVRLPVEKP